MFTAPIIASEMKPVPDFLLRYSSGSHSHIDCLGTETTLLLQKKLTEKGFRCGQPEFISPNMAISLLKFLILVIVHVVCNENFTNEDYNITHFDDRDLTVSYDKSVIIALEIRLFLIHRYILQIKIIVNSTEWEMSLEFHDFEQPWMRYALGMGSSETNNSIETKK